MKAEPLPVLGRSFGLLRMGARDPREKHRAASPLELFFDLVFVVAVSTSSTTLHHLETEGHLWDGVGAYLMVFFAVWWAWMNFTWFATAFDIDDWLYRVCTIVQMAGALVVASGAAAAMTEGNLTIVTLGYVIMRLAMVAQWVRVAVSVPAVRRVAVTYAIGITVVQALWVLRLLLPAELGVLSFLVLVVAELLVPVIAERDHPTPWNAHHIAERFSLFTLILLGESILASANAVNEALQEGEHLSELFGIAAAGLVLAASMWWIYFSREQHQHITSLTSSLRFGYFHYVIFAAAGAFSAGVEVVVDSASESAHLGSPGLSATIPVAVFILGIWALTIRKTLGRAANVAVAALAVVIGAAGVLGSGLLIAAIAAVVIVVILEATAPARRASPAVG